MEVQIAKGVWAIAVAVGLVAVVIVAMWVLGDSATVKAWLDMPLKDARIRDLAPLLLVAALVAR